MTLRRVRTTKLDERIVQKVDSKSVVVGLIHDTLILEQHGAPSLRGGWITQHCESVELEHDERYIGSYVGKIGNLVHVYWKPGDVP